MPCETILDLIAAQTAQRGSAIAILGPGAESFSYAALQREVDRLGDSLAQLGFGRGSRIAVALPNGPDAAVAMLAAMSWATCAPLHQRLDFDACATAYDALRVDALIAAEGAQEPALAAAHAARLPVLRLSPAPGDSGGRLALRGESPRSALARTPPRPDDVALLLQTSGTTARPKIVPKTHRALLFTAGPRPIDASDRCLCVAPLPTLAGLVYGVVLPLAVGASTAIIPAFDAARFFGWLVEFRPTHFTASPTVHAAIVDRIRDRRPPIPDSLRFVRSSSNAMSASAQQELESLLGVPVIQVYGSTETGLIARDLVPPGSRRAGAVGKPVDNELMVQGEDGGPLPALAQGEICVRGPGVMSGYENDPEGNALAFRDGWFRTGDLGYVDADGYLFVTGRIRELVNRGGLKVAPAEVDAAFLRHPAVRDAATVGVAHPSLGEDVVTAVILKPGESTTAQQLRAYALQNLAAFKVPSAVVLVGDLPRTPLGKVRRHVLAERLREAMRVDYVPPRDAEESLIAGIFAALLGLPRVGAFDNFFELGGDSLRGAQVIARLRAQTGFAASPAALFEAPTVEQFAQRLRSERANASAAAAAPPLERRTPR